MFKKREKIILSPVYCVMLVSGVQYITCVCYYIVNYFKTFSISGPKICCFCSSRNFLEPQNRKNVLKKMFPFDMRFVWLCLNRLPTMAHVVIKIFLISEKETGLTCTWS